MSTITFSEAVKEHFPLLAKYTPVLVNVHGEHHPELTQVRDIFAIINAKVQEQGTEKADVAKEFDELRTITNNYSIPKDACETYADTYQMLKSADKAYHS